jgi:hypothetical protein
MTETFPDQIEQNLADWPGDPELADLLRKYGPNKVDPWPIRETDMLATAFNRSILKLGERIVILKCGHRAVTKNRKSCHCSVCQAMVDRGADFDLFLRESGLHTDHSEEDDTDEGNSDHLD